jgi:hypothetical protein
VFLALLKVGHYLIIDRLYKFALTYIFKTLFKVYYLLVKVKVK